MLRISKLADYGTVVMAYLAQNFGVLHNSRAIGKATGITLPTVSKVLKLLTQADLIISQLGQKGGYGLTKNPKEISLGDIIHAMDGMLALTEYSLAHDANSCTFETHCAIRDNWQRINVSIYQSLKKISLAEMLVPLSAQKLKNDIIAVPRLMSELQNI